MYHGWGRVEGPIAGCALASFRESSSEKQARLGQTTRCASTLSPSQGEAREHTLMGPDHTAIMTAWAVDTRIGVSRHRNAAPLTTPPGLRKADP